MWEKEQEEDGRLIGFLLLGEDFSQVTVASMESLVTFRAGLNGVRMLALLIFVLLSTCLKPKVISHPSEHRYYKRTHNPWGLICAFAVLLANKSLGTGNSSNLAEQKTNQNTCLILFKFHGLLAA